MRLAFVAFTLMLCTVGAVSEARAQEARHEVTSDEDAALDRAAHELFQAGTAAIEDGRFDEALEHFRQAFTLSERPELLYNIGYAADRARRDEEALTAYRAYLERSAEGRYHERAEGRIAVLEHLASESSAAALDAPPRTPPPSVTARAVSEPPVVLAAPADRTAAHWLAASGGLVALVGGALLGWGVVDQQAVENPAVGRRWPEVEAAYDRGPALLVSGFVAAPVGLVMTAAGWLWSALSHSDAEGATAWRAAGSWGAF